MIVFKNFDEATDALRVVMNDMKRVAGFSVPKDFPAKVVIASELMKGGAEKQALEKIAEAVEMGRNILGAFLRNSIVSKQISEGVGLECSFFGKTIRQMDEENVHEDLMASLEEPRRALLEAVQQDRGTDFGRRIEAYNRLNTAIAKAQGEQARRDKLGLSRSDIARAEKAKIRNAQAERVGEPTRAQMREAQLAQAQAMRNKKADDLLALLG